MIILGIETSCDETAASVAEGNGETVKILSNVVASQIQIHKQYGGVVPEVAAREHVLKIIPVIDQALKDAGLDADAFSNNSRKKGEPKTIDAIAVTAGPGLITSLMVGVETAKTLSLAWNVPLVSINHIEGHIYANFINSGSTIPDSLSPIIFPALVLTVSGGHTMLVLIKSHGQYETIGETRDDAAGEAFDKGAKLMNLGYPGGPAIAAEAAKCRMTNDECRITLPRPMMDSPNFDFSFSGLKTSLLYKLKKDNDWKNKITEYSREYQQAIIDVLVKKTIKAAKRYEVKTVMLAGGVAANQKLRQQMADVFRDKLPALRFTIPDLRYTTDNAAMIAAAGYFKACRKEFTPWQGLKVDSNLEL